MLETINSTQTQEVASTANSSDAQNPSSNFLLPIDGLPVEVGQEAATQKEIDTPILEHPRYKEGNTENSETLEQFTKGLKELQKENPEILGATLFGSRLTGHSRQDSDVDTYIYLDADILTTKGIEFKIDEYNGITWGNEDTLKSARLDTADHFGAFLATQTSKDPTIIANGLHIKAISHELIQKQIQQYLEQLRQINDHQNMLEVWAQDGTASLEDKPQLKGHGYASSDYLAGLFHPDLLSGLDGYRATVIDSLASSGELGEMGWREGILDGLTFGEGHLDISDSSVYPVNLEQANKLYRKNHEQ